MLLVTVSLRSPSFHVLPSPRSVAMCFVLCYGSTSLWPPDRFCCLLLHNKLPSSFMACQSDNMYCARKSTVCGNLSRASWPFFAPFGISSKSEATSHLKARCHVRGTGALGAGCQLGLSWGWDTYLWPLRVLLGFLTV